MLAYVFWHWKQASVDDSHYAARQRAFHAALAGAPPDGYVFTALELTLEPVWPF